MSMDYKLLRDKMQDKNINQKELAAAIPMSESHFCRKLSGEYPFTQSEIIRICEVLDIEAGDINAYFFTEKS